MKILFVGIYIPPGARKTGGPVAVFSNLVDALSKVKTDHDIDVISQSYLYSGEIKIGDRVTVYYIPILRPDKLLSLIKMLARKKYDLINLQGVSELNVIAALIGKICGAKVIYSCHGLVPYELKLGSKLPRRLLIEEYLIFKLSDAIITVSRRFKQVIQKKTKYPADKIFVIYNGISEYWLAVTPDPHLSRRNNWLLFVGEPTKRKGFDLLLKAFSILKKKYPELQLIVVGKKPSDLIQQLDEKIYSSIRFIYPVDNDTLKKLYNEATVLVLPSLIDSFPLVVLEAMSQGLPVIISDQVGVSEIIENNKQGLIFPYNNVIMLANYIEHIITDEDLREKLSIEGRKIATSRTWVDVLNDYLKLFEKLYLK